MNRYGQSITWSTVTTSSQTGAPHLFSGICTAYSYRDQHERQLDDDEAGDFRALIQHSRKADISFDAKITEDSTDFLDLSQGAAITISGVNSSGNSVVLVRRAVEHWSLGQPKTASIQATHYPGMTQAGPAGAGTSLDAFTPSQSSITSPIITPGGKLIYSTQGLGYGAIGIVHELEIAQELTISEDDPSPDGKIVGAASHGYMRTARVRLLATGAVPASGTSLALTGGPDDAAEYRIESAEVAFAHKRGKMYDITAVWIPAFHSEG